MILHVIHLLLCTFLFVLTAAEFCRCIMMVISETVAFYYLLYASLRYSLCLFDFAIKRLFMDATDCPALNLYHMCASVLAISRIGLYEWKNNCLVQLWA